MRTEFEFLQSLTEKYGLNKVGDDCAILPKDSKEDLLISSDMLVEDIDFKTDWTKPEFIGHKSLAVSISDIAAMGGTPNFSLVSIGIPEHVWNTNFIDKFYIGYTALAEKYKVELVGGDISKTPNKIVVDSTVLGTTKKDLAILRSTAKSSDLIFVTGELGGANAGLKLLQSELRYENNMEDWKSKLLLKQLAPLPFQDSSDLTNFASSMIDLSDGLSSDLRHICNASMVGAKIYADKIPIDKNIAYLSDKNNKYFLSKNLDNLKFALHGGEDFELLFTVSPKLFKKNQDKILSFATQIGETTETVGKIELIKDGFSHNLESKGYQHF